MPDGRALPANHPDVLNPKPDVADDDAVVADLIAVTESDTLVWRETGTSTVGTRSAVVYSAHRDGALVVLDALTTTAIRPIRVEYQGQQVRLDVGTTAHRALLDAIGAQQARLKSDARTEALARLTRPEK